MIHIIMNALLSTQMWIAYEELRGIRLILIQPVKWVGSLCPLYRLKKLRSEEVK